MSTRKGTAAATADTSALATGATSQVETSHRRLNNAAVVLWRSARVVQLELGQRRVVIENVGPDEMSALLPREHSRSHRQTRPEQSAAGPPAADPALAELRDALDSAGFLTNSSEQPADPDTPAAHGASPQPLPAHLLPDLGALRACVGDAAEAVLRARRASAIAVHGTSRLAASVAATLAAAGVGWVQLVHGGDVAAADSCPGGLTPVDEGRRFGVAALDAIRRSAPDVDTTPIPRDRLADLVILTDPAPVETAVRTSFQLDGLAHLSASVDGSRAVIGPLVLPGVTGCLRCADLHRIDRDPAWPALAVQLASRPRRRLTSDVALCVATSGVAVSQALAYLDRREPATLGATLEWQLPDWRLRRRSWPPHDSCDCGAATRSAQHGRMGA
jgi:hypothetical protein